MDIHVFNSMGYGSSSIGLKHEIIQEQLINSLLCVAIGYIPGDQEHKEMCFILQPRIDSCKHLEFKIFFLF